MAQAALAEAGSALINKLGDAFLPGIETLVTSATDKVGFDLDTTGRARQAQWLEETARSTYSQHGCKVNIAIWNMHLAQTHNFDDPILTTGLSKMGNGGGFRVVVFMGAGWLKNEGDGGQGNWMGSGADGAKPEDGMQMNWDGIPEDQQGQEQAEQAPPAEATGDSAPPVEEAPHAEGAGEEAPAEGE